MERHEGRRIVDGWRGLQDGKGQNEGRERCTKGTVLVLNGCSQEDGGGVDGYEVAVDFVQRCREGVFVHGE